MVARELYIKKILFHSFPLMVSRTIFTVLWSVLHNFRGEMSVRVDLSWQQGLNMMQTAAASDWAKYYSKSFTLEVSTRKMSLAGGKATFPKAPIYSTHTIREVIITVIIY